MRIERRRLIAALGIAATGWPAGTSARAAAPAFDLPQLMQLLGRVRSGSATFVERREVAMLDRTIESSGRLSFEAPDTFVRETLKPQHDRIGVSGNTMTMSRDGRSRTTELDAAPEAAVLIEAIRGTLTGNRNALERLFEAGVSGSAERWTLDLVPRDAQLRGQVAAIKLRGEQSAVREVDVQLADGDRSVMKITPTAANDAHAPKATTTVNGATAASGPSAPNAPTPRGPAPDAARPGARPAPTP